MIIMFEDRRTFSVLCSKIVLSMSKEILFSYFHSVVPNSVFQHTHRA